MFLTISVFGGCWLLPACQFFCHRPCLGISTQVGVKVGRLVHGYRPHGLLNDVGNGRVRYLVAAESLEKYRGNLFNWYDLETKKPLPPRFVSSVDSGNFVAALVACGNFFGGKVGEICKKLTKETVLLKQKMKM